MSFVVLIEFCGGKLEEYEGDLQNSGMMSTEVS
jgi:hypothetical protein